MRGWGVLILVPMMIYIVYGMADIFWYNLSQIWAPRPIWHPELEESIPGINWWELLLGAPSALFVILMGSLLAFIYFASAFLFVTDATVRFDHKRKKVWMWTGKGPIEMDWANLTPRVESSVATAYATVKTYRGQYAELSADGNAKVSHGIPHVFQVGQVSAAAEGVLPSMEYVRRYMENGPASVGPPEAYLSHRVRWYAMFNLFGVADDWVRWAANRHRPGVAPLPWGFTLWFILFFPVFFPMQFSNWLSLVLAPKPKWPKELEAMHQADLEHLKVEEAQRRLANPLLDRAREAENPRRKPVIRVNGELISGEDESSRF